MKLLLGLLLAGAAVAGTLFAVGRDSAERVSAETAQSTAVGAAELALLRDELRATRDELSSLRAANEDLSMRLSELEQRPVAVQPRMPVATEASELEDDVRDMVAALQQPGTQNPGLETFVLGVLDQKEEREEEARRLRREEARVERLTRRMEELTAELGLSPYQQDEMMAILNDEAARRDTLISAMRETGDFDRRAVRESMETLRGETRMSLETVLTPEQLQQYEDSEGGRGGFRGPRGGRPDSGGGGGGSGGGGNGGGQGGGQGNGGRRGR